MWDFLKKKKNTKLPNFQHTPPPPEPLEVKEEKLNVLMSIKLINNKTDKEYLIVSKTKFGLNWSIKDNCISIQSNKNYDKSEWEGIGRFIDFSIIDTKFEEVKLIPEVPIHRLERPNFD